MKKLLFLLFILKVNLFADKYYLVMSKEPNMCQHIYMIFNSDLQKYGKLKLEEHKEFNVIKWDKKFNFIHPSGKPTKNCWSQDFGCKEAIFDINNDGKDEMVAFQDRHLSSDAYSFNNIVYTPFDGKNTTNFYYAKMMGVKFNRSSSQGIKELPVQFTYYGNNYIYIYGQTQVIKPFFFDNKYYLAIGSHYVKFPNKEIYKESTKLDIENQGLITIADIDENNVLRNQCVLIRARTGDK